MRTRNGWLVCAIGLAIVGPHAVAGTRPTREMYKQLMPEIKRHLIPRPTANAQFALYGSSRLDPARDRNPHDGIDDAVAARLLILAEKFSPVLHRQNQSVPRNFTRVMEGYHKRWDRGEDDLTECNLVRDHWDFSDYDERRNPAKSKEMFIPGFGTCGDSGVSPSACGLPDSIVSFLRSMLPSTDCSGRTTESFAIEETTDVYIDWPGHNAKSWRRMFLRNDTLALGRSAIYAHFFIHAPDKSRPSRYDFVIQYWFFYPFNDGGNDHEGDWEHINVHVTTRDASDSDSTIDESVIRNILDPANDTIVKALTIGRVDYYFHNKVVVVDYPKPFEPTLTPSRDQAAAAFDGAARSRAWEWPRGFHPGREFEYAVAYRRMYPSPDGPESYLNTHPICFLGGENKGLDEVVHLPWEAGLFKGLSFNSHGTYPFPGIWKDIGPTGSAESVAGRGKIEFLPPELDSAAIAGLEGSDWYTPKVNGRFVTYKRDHIILVPDWEHVLPLVEKDTCLLLRWAWLLVPMRWGFPISPSVGWNLIKRAPLGNISPVGPARNTAWNHVGQTSGYQLYEPQYLDNMVLVTPFDGFHNAFGILNIFTIPVVGSPITAVVRGAWPYLSPYKVVDLGNYRENKRTGRLKRWDGARLDGNRMRYQWFSAEGMWTLTFGQNKLAQLLPHPGDPEYRAKFGAYGAPGILVDQYRQRNARSLTNLRFSIRQGTTVETENSIFSGESRVEYRLSDTLGNTLGTVRGNIRTFDIRGSFKLSLWRPLKARARVFLRGGFGNSFYQLTHVYLQEAGPDRPRNLPIERFSEFFHTGGFLGSILPDSWLGGIGCEFVVLRELNLNFEYDRAVQRAMAGEDILHDRGKTSLRRDQIQIGIAGSFWL